MRHTISGFVATSVALSSLLLLNASPAKAQEWAISAPTIVNPNIPVVPGAGGNFSDEAGGKAINVVVPHFIPNTPEGVGITCTGTVHYDIKWNNGVIIPGASIPALIYSVEVGGYGKVTKQTAPFGQGPTVSASSQAVNAGVTFSGSTTQQTMPYGSETGTDYPQNFMVRVPNPNTVSYVEEIYIQASGFVGSVKPLPPGVDGSAKSQAKGRVSGPYTGI